MERMNQTSSGFSRRGPDMITEELVAVLLKNNPFEFKALFEVLYANLRARNAASGGEEMLRLRAYEKLQSLVGSGAVRKTGKTYQGIKTALMDLNARMKEFRARVVKS
jgi:hypothetical protein